MPVVAGRWEGERRRHSNIHLAMTKLIPSHTCTYQSLADGPVILERERERERERELRYKLANTVNGYYNHLTNCTTSPATIRAPALK